MHALALWLYSLLTWLAVPLLLRKLRRRARAEPGYGWAVAERFGCYAQAKQGPEAFLWLHAVSLGETRAAAMVLAQLRAQLPQMRLLLTHGTATGRAEGAKLLQAGDVQVWQPWDTPRAVRRFLHHWQPSMGILMETEVWPNLAAACRACGIPLVLANARLNARSHAAALRLAWLARPAYAGLTAVWAQTPEDAHRLRSLGAPVAGIFGNVKFDMQPDVAQCAQGRIWRAATARPVVMLASSREGEEALWLQAVQQRQEAKELQWLIVPRHPQRVDEVERLCRVAGFTVARRSQWQDLPLQADVWLGDSMGEMAMYYSLAHVALLGGSFAPLGGQNLIEAAACACPIVMGPHIFNFAEAAHLAEQAQAARRVPDMPAAVHAACLLAHDTQQQTHMGENARAFIAAHRGAAQATAAAISVIFAQQLVGQCNGQRTE